MKILLCLLLAGQAEGELSKLPVVKATSEAIYPAAALRDRVEARVALELDLDAAGKVESARIVQTATIAVHSSTAAPAVRTSTVPDYGFGQAALRAARLLEFEPAEAAGVPVPVTIGYTFVFRLPPPPPPPVAVRSSTTGAPPPPPGVVNLEGVVLERGTRARVAGALVTVFRGEGDSAQGFEATTDPAGRFRFLDLAPGEWKVQAEGTGYYPFRTKEEIVAGELTEVTYYIERGSYNRFDVLVEAERPKKEVTRRTLSVAEIVKVPGTLGDPVQVVENLPGVARAQPGQIVVRGSGPEDTDIYIDGIQVPLIYHFGGLRSVIPAEMIDRVDFFPGNFSVGYGRATGGIFGVESKRLAPDQLHGALDVSLLDTSLYLEIPLGEDAAIALAGRRSYFDVILQAVIPDDAAVGFNSAPVYYDYQLLGRWQPAAGHELKLFLFGSDDTLELLLKNPGDANAQLQSGNLSAATGFNRAVLLYQLDQGPWRNELRVGGGQDKIGSRLGNQFRFDLDVRSLQVRELLTYRAAESLSLSAGLDFSYFLTDLAIRAPLPPKEGDVVFNNDLNDVRVATIDDYRIIQVAPLLEAEWKPTSALTVVPGLRVDYYDPIDEWSVDPRVVARYQLDPAWTLKGGVGLVHQEPQPDETDVTFGNPDLGLEQAVQYSVGAEWKPLDFLGVDATLFYKDLSRLVSRTTGTLERDGRTVPAIYDNGGTGRVYGLELYLRHELANNLSGWLTYTLSRAERTDSGADEARLFDFDQTHILTVVASYQFPENWEAGLRFRLVSGNPYTPFVGGVFLSDLDQYAPLAGAQASDRLPLFHQLDLRVDKRWIFDTWRFSAYLSLVNSYNNPAVDAFQYNYDFSQAKPQQGIPIYPILGIKAEL